jgi:ABC-type branched-subunit amino acid transport system ATPase component
MKLLDVKQITSGYGKIPILHDISLHVERGEMISIIGPNGAGKSTLMHTIAGLLPVTQGEIHFQDRKISGLAGSAIVQLGLGYVPQRRNVFADMTVEENLVMGAYTLKNPKPEIDRMLALYPILKERLKQRAGTLSGGERQMLALAGAMLTKPTMLLLDEPTTGLAPQIIKGLIELIVQVKNQGTTIVWVVEENPRQVLQHADRVYLMDSGQIKAEFTGKQMMEEVDLESLFLGTNH